MTTLAIKRWQNIWKSTRERVDRITKALLWAKYRRLNENSQAGKKKKNLPLSKCVLIQVLEIGKGRKHQYVVLLTLFYTLLHGSAFDLDPFVCLSPSHIPTQPLSRSFVKNITMTCLLSQVSAHMSVLLITAVNLQ